MRQLLIILFSCFLAASVAGQNPDIKRTWHWYFGIGAGLDFSSGSPVVDTSSQVRSLSAVETSFTLSDTCGNLLLYGYDTIFSRTHQFVYDLNPIINTNTLTQMLAVPQPGNDSIVYIFCSNVIDARLYYVIVNLNLNGGEGDVIFVDTLIGGWATSPITQKLAAYHHCNAQDIWIVTKLGNKPQGKNLYSFLLTSAGLNTAPVVSSVVQHPLLGENAGGGIRFSPDGTMLAAAYLNTSGAQYIGDPDSNFVELYQFDNCTGVFSNPIIWNFQTPHYPAFSPDGTKLYVATPLDLDTAFLGMGYGADSSYIIQYDVSVYNRDSILASQYMMYFPDTLFGQMQLGPDGKIYVGDEGRNDLLGGGSGDSTSYKPGVIHNPNASGIACNYEPDAFNVFRNVGTGFPNFVDSYFRDLSYYDCATDTKDIPEQENILQILGNPAGEYLTLRNKAEQEILLRFFDITGKLIFSKKMPGNKTKSFNIHSLSAGMYIINAQTNNLFINLKFIKL